MPEKPASTARAPRSKPPVGKGNAQQPPRARLDQRIDQIKALVAAGETTPNIVRRVATMVKKESTDRQIALAKQAAFSSTGDEASAAKIDVPSIIWSEQPPAERTIERYVFVAKQLLEKEAAEVVKRGDLVLGIQYQRLNFIYLQCVSEKKWLTALEVVREVNRMHGLHDAVRLELSGPHGKPIQHQDVISLPTTEAGALEALRALIRKGTRMAGLTEIEIPLKQLTNGNGHAKIERDDFDADESL